MSKPEYEISYTKGAQHLVDRVTGLGAAVRHRTHLQYNGCAEVVIIPVVDEAPKADDDNPRVIDMRGSGPRRDSNGRFIRLVQVSYITRKDTGEVVRFLRRFHPSSLDGAVGKTIARYAARGKAWGIEVLDADGTDVTQDYECFAELS